MPGTSCTKVIGPIDDKAPELVDELAESAEGVEPCRNDLLSPDWKMPTAEEIDVIESENSNAIHLYKVGAFWEAYERSCFYFHRLLFPYQVKYKFVKKISKGIVNLGFNDRGVEKVKEKARSIGLEWNEQDGHRIDILGVSADIVQNFDQWKSDLIESYSEHGDGRTSKESITAADKKSSPKRSGIVVAFAIAYDLCLYLYKRSAGFDKDYKYSLGMALQEKSQDLIELLQQATTSPGHDSFFNVMAIVDNIRLKVRVLHDLKQLSHKQYFFVNQKLDRISEMSFVPESCSSRIAGEGPG